MAEFKIWKESYERANNSWFVKNTGHKSAGFYYYCNRSGNFKSRSTGKRHLKSQGTSKLNTYCTAGMLVRVKKTCLKIVLYKTHYGHGTSLCHLRIPETERLAIAGKLSQGVDIQRILDDIGTNWGRIFNEFTFSQKRHHKHREGILPQRDSVP